MNRYYECHITMNGHPEDIKPLVEEMRWKFSWMFTATHGDADLDGGLKCYATHQFNIRLGQRKVLNNLDGAAHLLAEAGVCIIRKKIEVVIYDERPKEAHPVSPRPRVRERGGVAEVAGDEGRGRLPSPAGGSQEENKEERSY